MAIGAKTNDLTFDLTNDGQVDISDRAYWVIELSNTYWGDSNFDGEWNSSDLVTVYVAAKYETGLPAGWSEGDWNGDGVFATNDFLVGHSGFPESGLFVGYERGTRPGGLQIVPEPSSIWLLGCGLVTICIAASKHRMHAD
jgi:hypothetical protein